MSVLKFLEYLACHPNHQVAGIDQMFAEQDAVVQQAYNSNNAELLRQHISKQVRFADKTTIFQL